jgi:hypothetical protein
LWNQELIRTDVAAGGARGDALKTKTFAALILGWFAGVLVGAGIFALFQSPGDKSYWSSVAALAAVLLAMAVANWVRYDRPKRAHAFWALAAALIVPALIITFSLEPSAALGGLLGGLTGALIVSWPYLAGKASTPRAGN